MGPIDNNNNVYSLKHKTFINEKNGLNACNVKCMNVDV